MHITRIVLIALSVMATAIAGATAIISTSPSPNHETLKIRNVVVPLLITNVSAPENRRILGNGSGVIFGPHYILTAAHVISNDDINKLIFKYIDNNTEPIELHIVKIDREADLALLTGDFDCPCAEFSSTSKPVIDDTLYAVGFPLFGQFKLQILSSGLMQGISNNRFASTNTAAPGSSGGGLFIKENGTFKWIGILEAIPMYHDEIQPWLVFSITNKAIISFLTGTDAFRYLI